MSQNLLQLMEESESVIDLEEKLKDYGFEFSNCREYMEWLDSEWSKISFDKVNEILMDVPVEIRFPTFSVDLESIEYQLHGIVHGWPIYLAPGWHPRKNIRKYVSEVVSSFNRPVEGEDYLYEQHMHWFFDLLRSQELRDKTHTEAKSESLLRDIGIAAFSIPKCIFGAVVFPVIFGKKYFYAKSIKNPKGVDQGCFYLTQKALTDEKYQAHFADFWMAQEMPQPFNIEKRYLSQKGSKSSLSMEPNAATGGERSLWVAGQLRDYVKQRSLNKLHYISGMMHTSEIAYFLQNPSFSFEKLEDYRVNRR